MIIDTGLMISKKKELNILLIINMQFARNVVLILVKFLGKILKIHQVVKAIIIYDRQLIFQN